MKKNLIQHIPSHIRPKISYFFYGQADRLERVLCKLDECVRPIHQIGWKFNWYCLDCDVDTWSVGQYYSVTDELWASAVPEVKGMLCLPCLQKRIGRNLEVADFTSYPINLKCEHFMSLVEATYGTETADFVFSQENPVFLWSDQLV